MAKTGQTKKLGKKIVQHKLAQCPANLVGDRKVVEPVGPSPQPKSKLKRPVSLYLYCP